MQFFSYSTIWYELHAREWPFKNQPAEVIIWQVGSGMKPNLTQIGMGKEISVSKRHVRHKRDARQRETTLSVLFRGCFFFCACHISCE